MAYKLTQLSHPVINSRMVLGSSWGVYQSIRKGKMETKIKFKWDRIFGRHCVLVAISRSLRAVLSMSRLPFALSRTILPVWAKFRVLGDPRDETLIFLQVRPDVRVTFLLSGVTK